MVGVIAELHGRPAMWPSLDEEEGSVGGGVAVDVDPSEDDGCDEQHSQHDAHDGPGVNGGTHCSRREVISHTFTACLLVELRVV